MRLRELLGKAGMPPVLDDPEITGLACDSRRVNEGDLFFALPGEKADGREFAAEAVRRGARAVVTSGGAGIEGTVTISADSPRAAMARIAAAFHGEPSRSLKCIGVTGTNGKTTTAFLASHLLDAAGLRSGLIGTVKYVVAGAEMDAPRTTPESIELQDMLARMRDAGGRSVAMEVSSHALVQHRADHIAFDAAVFTNLTQDHLDYHKTMENYFAAKSLLFEAVAQETAKKGRIIVNADDRWGHRLVERFSKIARVETFGRGVGADYRIGSIKSDGNGTTFQLDARKKSFLVRLPLIGLFNVYNAVGALAAVTACGVELRASVAALAVAPQVPGRLERVPAKRNFQVFVDYAHTDDALRNVLRTLRELKPVRLVTVFGCGGDRDRAKRPLMAAAAEEFSDLVVVTSDNPRTEDPEAILRDVEAGFRGSHHVTIADRAEAIAHAVRLAEAGDIVLVAGKGHENYQEVNGVKTPFDDVQIAARAIASNRTKV